MPIKRHNYKIIKIIKIDIYKKDCRMALCILINNKNITLTAKKQTITLLVSFVCNMLKYININ